MPICTQITTTIFLDNLHTDIFIRYSPLSIPFSFMHEFKCIKTQVSFWSDIYIICIFGNLADRKPPGVYTIQIQDYSVILFEG